jgi:uncharacterized protein
MATVERAAATAAQWLACGNGFVTIQILAHPGASQQRIVRLEARGLVVALNSRPDKGKANDELIGLLARTLRVPRTAITIVRGLSTRHKTVRIATADPAGLARTVAATAGG